MAPQMCRSTNRQADPEVWFRIVHLAQDPQSCAPAATYREQTVEISQGLTSLYGSVAADVARGLLLRMDHGSQYLSDHFIKQVKFWGIKPSFAFVEQPQTNGVAERFNRTLKEQAIYGSIFRNIEEVRRAAGKFVQDYNAEWRVEKNGFRSPRQARDAWFAALSKQAA